MSKGPRAENTLGKLRQEVPTQCLTSSRAGQHSSQTVHKDSLDSNWTRQRESRPDLSMRTSHSYTSHSHQIKALEGYLLSIRQLPSPALPTLRDKPWRGSLCYREHLYSADQSSSQSDPGARPQHHLRVCFLRLPELIILNFSTNKQHSLSLSHMTFKNQRQSLIRVA